MKRQGLSPNDRMFASIFRHITSRKAVTKDNTALIERLKGVYDDFEAYRHELMLGDKQRSPGNDKGKGSSSDRAVDPRSHYESVAGPVAYWILFLAQIGEREKAWELLNRLNTKSVYPTPDGYPPLPDMAVRCWQQSYLERFPEQSLTETECQRFKTLWKARVAFLRSAGKAMLREWTAAKGEQKALLESAWESLKPSRLCMLELTKLAWQVSAILPCGGWCLHR